MSKLSLSKNKAKKKLDSSIVPSGQKTLTSYFTSTAVKKTEGKNAKEEKDDDVVVLPLVESKENDFLTKTMSDVKPTIEKHHLAALQETSLPQKEAAISSPLKKKIRVSCAEESSITETIKTLNAEIKEFSEQTCVKIEVKEQEVAAVEHISNLELSDFDSWSDYEVEADEIPTRVPALNNLDLSTNQRCIIRKIEQMSDGSKQVELASFGNREMQTTCLIKESWAWESNLSEGAVVNVRAVKTSDGVWQVCHDPEEVSLLVEEPDLLLSCTTVMSALRCRRSAVLSELFKGLGMQDSGGYLALGKLMHEVTQQCLAEKLQSQEKVAEVFEALLQTPRVIYDLYAMNNDLVKLREAAAPYFSTISKFLQFYSSEGNKYKAEVLMESSKQGSDTWPGKIEAVVDIEDTLWMPQLGLKGKLDLTSKIYRYNNPYSKMLAPLELKTGRTDTDQVAHRGQLMLYTAMLAEAEQRPVDYGLLIYLKTCAVKEVRANKGELRDAIIMRNELAKAVRNSPTIEVPDENFPEKRVVRAPALPQPIKRPRECIRCQYLEVCSAYSSKEDHHSPVQEDRLKERKGNLTQMHLDYFIHWTCLSQIEEKNSVNCMDYLWTKTPQKRESEKAICLCDLNIVSCQQDEAKFKTTLLRAEESKFSSKLNSTGFNPGDFIVFANEKRIVLGLGTVASISASSLELVLDKNFAALYGKEGYSIDLYKSNRMLTTKLVALANLLADSDEAHKLRQLIIDRAEPAFVENSSMNHVMKIMPEIVTSLNSEQRDCVQKVLEAKDYVLVRGLPGSGKTATIVALVRILAALGYSVLVTSHTNSAVDNVLCKLVPHDLKILRLGASTKFASSLKGCTEEALLSTATSMDHLSQLMNEKTIIGVTCTSANHPLLRRKRFDYCIVDEATQVPQPSAISALLCAKVFVLVGDPDQLQPVVSNKDAQALGMQETLFDRLYQPERSAVLGLQYRMNSAICDLANKMTYKGALKCGSVEVAEAKFILPKAEVLESSPKWVQKVLEADNGVVFVDTGCTKLKADEGENEDVSNDKEAALLHKLIQTLIQGGIDKRDIGVMTPFRRQVTVLASKLSDPEVEISTVDQFQGKDKLICLVSFVKSYDDGGPQENSNRGGILTDTKRLTVAITRARVKLILVGDLESLQHYEPLRNLKTALGDKNTLRLSDQDNCFAWSQIM